MRKFLTILLAVLTLFSLAGCMTTESGRLPVYEWGYYRYAADEKHGWAYIVGLTEEGKQLALQYLMDSILHHMDQALFPEQLP